MWKCTIGGVVDWRSCIASNNWRCAFTNSCINLLACFGIFIWSCRNSSNVLFPTDLYLASMSWSCSIVCVSMFLHSVIEPI